MKLNAYLNKINNALEFQNTVIDKLLLENANYLKNFRSKIASGDYYQVKEAVINAAHKISEITLSLSNQTEEDAHNLAIEIASSYLAEKDLHYDSSLDEIVAKAKIKKVQDGTLWWDSDTVAYSVVAVVAVVAAVAVLAIFLAVPYRDDSGLNTYWTEKYLTDITLQLKNI